MAVRRETRVVEEQTQEADVEYEKVSRELRRVTQERLNTEEELMACNVRLKQLLGELRVAREAAAQQSAAKVQDNKMTMGELTRKVETVLMNVLEERFKDEAFTSAITEQSVLSTDKVRVEFEGDEVFWSLQDNYSFDMLLQDAARYWDVAPQDAMLVDERGAIWPSDAYVGLELQRCATSQIKLRIKPVAITVEDEIEMYGKEGEDSSDESEEEMDMSMLAIASSAEDDILRAQALGNATRLTTKQKLALRKKLNRELYWFLAFVTFFIWSLYSRRTVKEAFRLQEAITTAFVEEEFGDYNEKSYFDIANAEELFDWMVGPLADGLFPDELYNGMEIPADRKGYVMTYNRIIGKLRLRQLRVKPSEGCELSPAVEQSGTTKDGRTRRRQFVDYCYARYSRDVRDVESFGLNNTLQIPFTGGFAYTSEMENKLNGTISGLAGEYDGSGFVRDVDVSSTREEFELILDSLKSNLWIDERTRAVVISMNLYNGNYNYYCVTQFLVEFTQGGTVIPTATNKILRMDMYEPGDFQIVNKVLIQYVPDALTILGALGYLLRFLYKMYRMKKVTRTFRPLLRDAWNLIDLLMLATMGVTYLLRFQFYLSEERSKFDPFDVTAYQEMSALASSYSVIVVFDAATVLVLVVKSLKFFALQKDLMLLQKTLVQALADLTTFLCVLIFLFIGFIIMGLNIFGVQAAGFNNLPNTLGTLFLILLGEFDYDEMRQVNELWAIIFFLFFMIFMFFIVLNIFLAILNDAYTVVHTNVVWEELEKRKPLSLREKFEVRKAIWRERKNIARMKKMKKEKVKEAKKMKKEVERKQKDREIMDTISKRKRKERRAQQGMAEEEDAGVTSSTQERRTVSARTKPFQ